MKKILCLYLMISIVVLTGCAGREANPVPTYLPGDENLSCEALKVEMSQIQAEILRLNPKADKFGQNALCVAGGCLFIVPFFFMDLKESEKIEIEALRRRYNHLMVLATNNGCNFHAPNKNAEKNLEDKKVANK